MTSSTNTEGTNGAERAQPLAGPDPDRTMSVTIFPGALRAQQYAELAPVVPADDRDPASMPEPVVEEARSTDAHSTDAHSTDAHSGGPAEHRREPVSAPSWPVTPPTAAAAHTAPEAANGGGAWVALERGPLTPVTAPQRVAPAQWGWRGRCNRLSAGVLKLAPATTEVAHRDAIATIGRATWPRAVNVVVANAKGASGKTPTTVILGGILGQVRGGSVLAWEATEVTGTLSLRAEGSPTRGLGELLTDIDRIHSAGNLAGYTAPQTSHADVLASIGPRWSLSWADVVRVRQVVDRYYRMTITDTGGNPAHEAYRAALHTADVVVVPCLPTIDALAGLEQIGEVLRAAGGHVSAHDGLYSRVVVILGHDGGPENPKVADAVRERLDSLGLPVVEVPHDATIRDGGPITLAALSEKSSRAWTLAAAAVVTALKTAPTTVDLVARVTGQPPAQPHTQARIPGPEQGQLPTHASATR